MESKIQKLVNELSKNERVQALINDVHVLQDKLNAEMNRTLSKFKKSAGDIEKNILAYKKQLLAQKGKLEKELRLKAKSLQSKPAAKTAVAKARKSAKAAKVTVKKATKTAKKKAVSVRKAASKR